MLAKDEAGNIYVEKEFCRPNLTLGEAAEEIVKFIFGTHKTILLHGISIGMAMWELHQLGRQVRVIIGN